MDSRSALTYTHKYPVVTKALAALKQDASNILRIWKRQENKRRGQRSTKVDRIDRK